MIKTLQVPHIPLLAIVKEISFAFLMRILVFHRSEMEQLKNRF